MPRTRKESFIFTMIMCFGMVSVMSVYNLWINGGLAEFKWSEFLIGSGIAYVIAFCLDIFVVATFAKKIAFKLPINKEKPIQIILAISSCMVIGMVFGMSLFGVIKEVGLTNDFFKIYSFALLKNLIVALPLQLFIMGPIVRKIFMKIYY
ncbi:DUF2798 domain-containing protein [Carnobacterium gallinarum]|uniref:DUF2798 domain-containing protein n=1 Tax=Carnobacterium gallinarum TaxID=2749 RepID=UPI0005505B83|nr:DUF2798 domain-containing protein [Carnobacterium gallinarum]